MSESNSTTTNSAVTSSAKSTTKTKWWRRLIPTSVLGITAVAVAFSIGAALSGTVFYSYYEYQLTNTEKRVDSYIEGFDERFRTASDTIEAERQNAQAAIQKELEPLRQTQAEGGTLVSLVQKVEKSVWRVETLNENGEASVGSAFIVESSDKESVLVGSFNTIKAATRTPGPKVFATKGNDRLELRLDNWVEDKDLAVMTLPKGNQPKLTFVSRDSQPRIGERVFAASGLGTLGASATQGFVSDNSQTAIQHDAPIGSSFQGGPLLNSAGEIVGISSITFAPYNFAPVGAVTFATPIRTSCEKLLRCPADANSVTGPASR